MKIFGNLGICGDYLEVSCNFMVPQQMCCCNKSYDRGCISKGLDSCRIYQLAFDSPIAYYMSRVQGGEVLFRHLTPL